MCTDCGRYCCVSNQVRLTTIPEISAMAILVVLRVSVDVWQTLSPNVTKVAIAACFPCLLYAPSDQRKYWSGYWSKMLSMNEVADACRVTFERRNAAEPNWGN